MSQRNSGRNRPSVILSYGVPALLWLGIGAVAWFSVSELSTKAPTAHRTPPASPQQTAPASLQTADNTQGSTSNPPPSLAPSEPRADAEPGRSPSQTNESEAPAGSPEDDAGSGADSESGIDHASSSPAHTAPQPAHAGDQASVDTPHPAPTSASATARQSTGSAHIARAQLTSGIRDHEPVDHLGGVVHSHHQARRYLYYFTQIQGLKGQTVTHAWWHEGELRAKATLRIGGNSWRTDSAVKLTPDLTGSWRVVVTDSRGHTLSTAHFTYATP